MRKFLTYKAVSLVVIALAIAMAYTIDAETKDTRVSSSENTVITEQSVPEQDDKGESSPVCEDTFLVPKKYSEKDVSDIAKVLYRECRGLGDTEKACVVWTILNRADKHDMAISSVVRAPGQYAFREDTPVRENLVNLAEDVLNRWSLEKAGVEKVGRVLPKDYLYFEGDGSHNYFRNNYKKPYKIWDYSYPSPYEN